MYVPGAGYRHYHFAGLSCTLAGWHHCTTGQIDQACLRAWGVVEPPGHACSHKWSRTHSNNVSEYKIHTHLTATMAWRRLGQPGWQQIYFYIYRTLNSTQAHKEARVFKGGEACTATMLLQPGRGDEKIRGVGGDRRQFAHPLIAHSPFVLLLFVHLPCVRLLFVYPPFVHLLFVHPLFFYPLFVHSLCLSSAPVIRPLDLKYAE